MYAHGGSLPASPVQPSPGAGTITGGHRYTRRSRRPVDLFATYPAAITLSDISLPPQRHRVTRATVARTVRNGT